MTDVNEQLKQIAIDANVPTTETEIIQEFETLKDNSSLNVKNTSAFAPFWRFVKAAAVAPALWLLDLLIYFVLPQAFVKLATGIYLDLHAWAVNLVRKEPVKAQGHIDFARVDTTAALNIPIGTVVQSLAVNGITYQVKTTSAGNFAAGQPAISVAVEALEEGEDYNLSAGYYSIVTPAIPGVTATNAGDWLTTPGADEESDDDLRERIRNQYTAINQWHTDAVYTSIISSFDNVSTANIFFEKNAPRGPGSANAYVMFEQGTPSPEFIASIQSTITDDGNHGHGDDLQVFAMPETFHDVSCLVWGIDGITSGEKNQLAADVEQYIRCTFRENNSYESVKTRPQSLFSFSTLLQELHNEFPNLQNVGFNLTHIDVGLEIPRLNTLTVTLQN